jgi:energy-coupling factor transporter ATP-binding protein EcfA2
MSVCGAGDVGMGVPADAASRPSAGPRAFFWGPEAGAYFFMDNLHDELSLGLRWHGQEEKTVDASVSNLLRAVGLGHYCTSARLWSPLHLSGGEQQRLLVAVLMSRQVPWVIGLNPLIYVDYAGREPLFRLIGQSAHDYGGRFLVASTEMRLPADAVMDTLVLRGHKLGVATGAVGDEYALQGRRTEAKPSTAVANHRARRCTLDSEPLMRVEGGVWRYPNGIVGVRVQRLDLYQGRIYAVCGPNGGGKSSLLRLLISSRRLSDGCRMYFGGNRVRSPFRELVKRRRVSYSLQDPNIHIVGGTVAEHLASARAPLELAESLGLGRYLDEDLLSAPYWVRQAVVFAAAISLGSDLVILDEPLDGIAYRIFGGAAVDILAAKVEAGATVLLVTHNPALARQVADTYIWVSEAQAHRVGEGHQDVDRAAHDWLSGADYMV